MAYVTEDRTELPTYRMSSSDPFQELVDTLKRVLLHPSSSPVCPAPAPPQPSTTPSTSSPIVFASPMARPAPFTGSAEECNGFLLQISLTIDLHPQMFPTDQSKIAFLITSLTGSALQWAETILNQAGPATQSFSHFIAHFREVFSSSPGDSSVGEQLFRLCQGTMPIHQYSLKFRTLAAASGWNEPSLLTASRQGFNSRLRLQLAAFDDTYGLEKFIQLAIRCSNRLQSRSEESLVAIATPPIRQPETSDPPEPMQTDCNRLSSTKRRKRLTEGLCLYCGASGHMILDCPLRPPRALVSTIRPPITKMNPLSTCAQLTAGDFVVSVTTLLDHSTLPAAPTPDLGHGDRLRDPINNRQTPHPTPCQTQCWTFTTANRAVASRRTTSTGSGGFNG